MAQWVGYLAPSLTTQVPTLAPARISWLKQWGPPGPGPAEGELQLWKCRWATCPSRESDNMAAFFKPSLESTQPPPDHGSFAPRNWLCLKIRISKSRRSPRNWNWKTKLETSHLETSKLAASYRGWKDISPSNSACCTSMSAWVQIPPTPDKATHVFVTLGLGVKVKRRIDEVVDHQPGSRFGKRFFLKGVRHRSDQVGYLLWPPYICTDTITHTHTLNIHPHTSINPIHTQMTTKL